MNKAIILFIALSATCTSVPAEQRFQSHESIYRIVESTVAKKIATTTEYSIDIIPLDSLLQLPECTKPLDAFTTTDPIKAGRISIGVRCSTEKKWSVFVSAIIKVYEKVLILSQSVQRGEIITPTMFFSERRDVSKLRDDFFTAAEQAENKQASRPLAAGTILSQRNTSEPLIVKKNDKVLIQSMHSALAITMSGIAMTDGFKGQLVRVKNQNSGRIINATVIEPGLVSVK